MKIALLNDTHFGCRNDSPAFINYQILEKTMGVKDRYTYHIR